MPRIHWLATEEVVVVEVWPGLRCAMMVIAVSGTVATSGWVVASGCTAGVTLSVVCCVMACVLMI